MIARWPPNGTLRAPTRRWSVNAALTGMIAQRDRVPNVPLTVEEIVRDAWICNHLGATILHLHARDADGRPA